MFINGLQKLTLLDFPGRCACTVFLAGCNYRCPFCHNSELIPSAAPELMTGEDFLRFLSGRKGILDGVCFTGGEPLMYPELRTLVSAVKELGFAVKLDTNGSFPDKLKALVGDGLVDYVAMDIKNCRERYAQTCGLERVDLDKIDESVRFLIENRVDYEFRTTVVEQLHNEESFRKIASWLGKCGKYYLQAFADRDSVVFSGLTAPSAENMAKYAEIMASCAEKVEIRGM